MIRDSLSILVVDDMKFSCEFIRRALTKEGYTSIEVVNSAPDALSRLEEKPVDVVLADWLMPEMDGLELTCKIRQLDEQRYHYTGIVLLTAKDDIASIRTAFEEGVDDYIVKPPNQIELAARIYAAGRIATMQNDLLDTTRALREQIEQECTVDRITGLGRLEDTQQRLDALLRQTMARGGATCCAILKINNPETTIAQHGSSVQDQLLSSIANRICRQVRPIDLVGHIAKDEFLIAMYYNQVDDARCRNFKRILYDLNHRSFKTTHGFLNISCAMAMTMTHKDNMIGDVKELISITRKKLIKSVEMGSEEVAT
ncbi:MAG: response regulator [Gammaproteobacteria bacterium]|nr:response regulator [Gammaproteobacteria bacterium]